MKSQVRAANRADVWLQHQQPPARPQYAHDLRKGGEERRLVGQVLEEVAAEDDVN